MHLRHMPWTYAFTSYALDICIYVICPGHMHLRHMPWTYAFTSYALDICIYVICPGHMHLRHMPWAYAFTSYALDICIYVTYVINKNGQTHIRHTHKYVHTHLRHNIRHITYVTETTRQYTLRGNAAF